MASILFSDIRSFTSLSERMGARETVLLLNEYFTRMVDSVFKYNGVLDKFIGDGLMAVFGAPFSSGEDADRAVKTGVDMMRVLVDFNQQRTRRSKSSIDIGIGISTDEVVSGNIGSLQRMDYTVIGDGVNLASRLEGANKLYKTNILISEFTFKQLKDIYVSREIDVIRVQGKSKPVAVYEILDFHDDMSFPHLCEVLELYHAGLMAYRKRAWAESIGYFKEALHLNASDRVSQLYLQRCEYYACTPPAEAWDGVWVMESK
jgi:adenylate cyclase